MPVGLPRCLPFSAFVVLSVDEPYCLFKGAHGCIQSPPLTPHSLVLPLFPSRASVCEEIFLSPASSTVFAGIQCFSLLPRLVPPSLTCGRAWLSFSRQSLGLPLFFLAWDDIGFGSPLPYMWVREVLIWILIMIGLPGPQSA